MNAVERRRLLRLEEESIYVIREAASRLQGLGALWSMGKDSSVLLHLIEQSFGGTYPFPLIHVDTSYKIPEMIAFRDRIARERGLPLLIGRNEGALSAGMNPKKGRLECCQALKTDALFEVMSKHGLKNLLVGIRRDEERARAKELVFSRRKSGIWKEEDQAPEIFNTYSISADPEVSYRVHPLLAWSEVDVWEYIQLRKIEVVSLYFSKSGKRYRSLGCLPCTLPISSKARTVAEIIDELKLTNRSERAGRGQDQASLHALESLRRRGYM